ncbi:MAG TPA: sulfite exporter TauE/SafE family protein [Gaiellaceae bacterium]|nr:sulfite exporter TauE/SafE family protein [Gaiellaceae bacterium]
MRRRIAIALVTLSGALAASLVTTSPASAHPLGNFTINRYAGIEVAGSEIYLRYALDVAEIPTYQLGADIRKPGYPARLALSLELGLDGRRVPLRMVAQRVTTRPGAGGLVTLRLDVVYRVDGAGQALTFDDRSFPERIGWREVTLSARDGGRVVDADVPARSSSDELRAYPADLLRSPLDVSSARASVRLGSTPGSAPAIGEGAAPVHVGGEFESLIERGELSLGALLLALLVAAFWGAAHALTPGHGKAIVAAYLVGTRGRPRDAFFLGGTVTIAHTAGVFALGWVTLGLSAFIVPEQLYPWLTLVSGGLVVAVGASVLRQRLRSRGHHHGHDHHHDHGHDHPQHEHQHAHHDALTSKGILGVGIAAGLLPCPSALVVLLSAIALHRVGLGLALIVAFSVGLAATITAIGLVAVLARRTFGRLSLDGPLVRALPAVSAGLILAVGLVITARALPGIV